MLRLHRALILTVGILFVCLGVEGASGAPGTQTAPPGAVDPELLIGDGAKECSAAKMALAAAPHHPQLSSASTNIDITYYHLSLTFPMTTNTLSGVVRVEGTVVGSTMSTLVLDLQSTMIVDAVQLADGTPCSTTHPGAILNITLPAPVAVGGTVKVDITYHGAPQQGGFGYFVFGTRAGDRFAWSLSEPYGAREWFPCKDHPSDKADSSRVTVTVPAAYRVGSNGLLVSETTVGPNKVYDWVTHYRISNYLISVAIGDYTRHTGTYTRSPALAILYGPLTMMMDHLVYNDGSDALPSGWSNSADMISVFEEWYGPYGFANEKYGHSECTFSGGMEHQTMTSLNGSSASLVSHELGHQWYGDKVTTKTWPHLWLNEGFATYSALLYFQQRPVAYPGTYEANFASTYNSALTATGTIVLQDTTDVANMFASSRVYNKGGMVLHMLRSIVGDNVFKNIMKSYATDPALQYNCARTSDFKRVVETVTGSDWDTFFSQWVENGTGYPSYTKCMQWVPTGNGDYRVQVTLHQIQALPTSNVNVFVMPVPIVIHTTGGDVSQVVLNDQRDQTFVFFVPNPVTGFDVDPNKAILRADPIPNGPCDPIGTDAGPLAIRTDIVSVYPNPATGAFQVQYVAGEAGKIDLAVYDVAGRRVLSRTVAQAAAGPGAELFSASKLPAGVYFVRMRAAHGELITRKLVVIR